MTKQKPLAGLTIIEAVSPVAPVALALAAGMCGRVAQDMGAHVIRLEVDKNALLPEIDSFLNIGKERVRVAREAFPGELAKASEQADCVVTDVGLHGEAKFGAPSTVCLAMSNDNPLGGSEFTLEARSGLLDLVGDPDKQPLRLGGHQIAYAAGLAAYIALLDLLTMHGVGSAVAYRRVDLLDIAIWLNWKAIGEAALGLPVLKRSGNDGNWSVAPCQDGFVAVVYRSKDWDTLKRMLDDKRLDDPRFETESARTENRAVLNAILREAVAPLGRAEIRQLALEYRIPLGPVWTPAELLSDPHFLARTFFHSRDVCGQTFVLPAVPVKWNGTTFAPGEASLPVHDDA
jgi:crotonobetainyl-CoA:carnitine CoA-transferase CaiB-like acyl-CoA transferase